MTKWDRRDGSGLGAGTGAGAFSLQALVEYGALNSILRDASQGLARVGGWAAQNWYITAAVLGVIIYLALRPKR